MIDDCLCIHGDVDCLRTTSMNSYKDAEAQLVAWLWIRTDSFQVFLPPVFGTPAWSTDKSANVAAM